MNSNLAILEQIQIASGFLPFDIGTARTGDAVSLKNYRRLLVVFFKGAGTAGDDPTITLLQGTDVAFATNKALNFTTVYKKQGADLEAVGQWTKVTQAAGNTYTDATSAEVSAIWAVEIKAEDLDIANNYDCVRASVGDVGANAQLGCVLYLLADPVQMMAPESMRSAIID